MQVGLPTITLLVGRGQGQSQWQEREGFWGPRGRRISRRLISYNAPVVISGQKNGCSLSVWRNNKNNNYGRNSSDLRIRSDVTKRVLSRVEYIVDGVLVRFGLWVLRDCIRFGILVLCCTFSFGGWEWCGGNLLNWFELLEGIYGWALLGNQNNATSDGVSYLKTVLKDFFGIRTFWKMIVN